MDDDGKVERAWNPPGCCGCGLFVLVNQVKVKVKKAVRSWERFQYTATSSHTLYVIPHNPPLFSTQISRAFSFFFCLDDYEPTILEAWAIQMSSTLYLPPTKSPCIHGVTILTHRTCVRWTLRHCFARYSLEKRTIIHTFYNVNLNWAAGNYAPRNHEAY